jgi:hypothetical protein
VVCRPEGGILPPGIHRFQFGFTLPENILPTVPTFRCGVLRRSVLAARWRCHAAVVLMACTVLASLSQCDGEGQ